MINFYNVNSERNPIRSDRWLGKLVRLPLRLIPKSAVLPIIQGPARGLKWIVGSYNHGCWLGSYEYEKQQVIPRMVSEGDVVYDIGAHVGYFTILFARLVGPSGQVVAFEPFQSNYGFILRHLALNQFRNVIPVEAGVTADKGDAAYFDAGSHSATGRLTDGNAGRVKVKVVNLIDFIRDKNLRVPDLIKMDIEGAEQEVVPSILDFVTENRIKLLISTHSDSITKNLVELLSARGFRITPLQWANRPRDRRIDNATLLSAVL